MPDDRGKYIGLRRSGARGFYSLQFIARGQHVGRSRLWKSVRVETDTHVADTSIPVFEHEEFLAGMAFGRELLGVWIKPIVRVKMARA